MKISVAMATFNGGKFIGAQLASIANQSIRPDELVVGDDGSTDDTLDIVGKFARETKIPTNIYQNESNLGHEQNFGKVLSHCTGDIIFLSDQDDQWYPNKIEKTMQNFAGHENIGVLVHDVDIVDENMVPTGYTLMGQLSASGTLGASSKSLVHGCATAIRTSMLPLILPMPDLQYGHDTWIHDVGNFLGCRLVEREPLLAYRRHGDNSSQSVLHSPRNVSWKDMVAASKSADMVAAYEKRAAALTMLLGRLADLGDAAYRTIPSVVSYEEALSRVERARSGFMLRAELQSLQGLSRLRLIGRMILGGHYADFLGWRSLAKDLLR